MITDVKWGRPKAMRSKPIFMDPVFDDPLKTMAAIRAAAPFPTLPAYYNVESVAEYDGEMFFRHSLTDELFVHNPNWIAAARASFDAGIVDPVLCLLNVAAPMGEMGAHIDLPTFRGFSASQETKDLLSAMINSELFYDWMVPFASGLAWFYTGEGGEFLYWEDGTQASPRILRPPFWNIGVMSDNEAMFHAVAPVGMAQERERISQRARRSNRLFHLQAEEWEIRDDEGFATRLDQSKLRMSLLWKARVFLDEAHKEGFSDTRFDLTPTLIAEVFCEDLERRGVAFDEPSDPLDRKWQQFLVTAYPPPFSALTTDYLR